MTTTDAKPLLLAPLSMATVDSSSVSPGDITVTTLASTLILESFQMSPLVKENGLTSAILSSLVVQTSLVCSQTES